jgi:hypothetical protein
LNSPCLVVHCDDHRERRVPSKRLGELRRIDEAVGIGIHDVYRESERSEQLGLFENGGVFDAAQKDALFFYIPVAPGTERRPQHGEEGEGVGFSAPGGEDDVPLARSFAA